MCKPKPGPRCSGHAKTIYAKARGDFNKAKGAWVAAETAQKRAEELGLSDASERAAVTVAARETFHTAQTKFAEAKTAYDSTPVGLEELQRKIDAATAKSDSGSVKSLTYRLVAGEKLRAEQTAAYKQFLADGNRDVDVVPDEIRQKQAPGQGKLAVTNRTPLSGKIWFPHHALQQAEAKGFTQERMESVLRAPERVTPVKKYPGQLRYCGDGLAVVCDGNRVVTVYPDGVMSGLRPDQTDKSARGSQRVKRYNQRRKPTA